MAAQAACYEWRREGGALVFVPAITPNDHELDEIHKLPRRIKRDCFQPSDEQRANLKAYFPLAPHHAPHPNLHLGAVKFKETLAEHTQGR